MITENEVSIRGRVVRELIARFTSDNLIGRKIKSGELRKKLVEPPWKCPEHYTMKRDPYEKLPGGTSGSGTSQ